jgi:hypothetical protein
MPHVVELAPTGRAKCRACGQLILARTQRFGERVSNPYGDAGSETTHWYHVSCAAFTRPEAFLLALPSITADIENRGELEREAQLGAAHERVPRIRSAERSPTGRATCRSCREPIAKDSWRITLAYYEEGRFVPGGFIHVTCAKEYFSTSDVLPRIRHFSPGLTDQDFSEIGAIL